MSSDSSSLANIEERGTKKQLEAMNLGGTFINYALYMTKPFPCRITSPQTHADT